VSVLEKAKIEKREYCWKSARRS